MDKHRYEHMEFNSVQEFIDWHRADMKLRHGSDYFEKVRKRNQRAARIDKVTRIVMYTITGAFVTLVLAGLIKVMIYGHG
jgi:hypothetical protein